jgi:hypothetical protein
MSFDLNRDFSLEELLQSVVAIKELPNQLAKLISGITEEQLNSSYREGGWNVRQIIHHLADSHMNAYIRTKHIIAQDVSEMQVYDQDIWASDLDATFHHEASFMIILGLHQRWSLLLLECLKQPEIYLTKSLYHSERKMHLSLAHMIALYAWHGNHHLTQIQAAISCKN